MEKEAKKKSKWLPGCGVTAAIKWTCSVLIVLLNIARLQEDKIT